MEFPVYIQVVSKAHLDYPPANLTVYAIVANCEDLTICTDADAADYLSNFLNTVLLDMGVCSVYETITTDLYLVNNTLVTQICGFVDIPPVRLCLVLEIDTIIQLLIARR